MTCSGRLRTDDGLTIEITDRPAQGTRHEVAFGVTGRDRIPVVIKLERVPGAVERERAALAWLGGRGGPAPELITAGPARLGGDPVVCLITARGDGAPPETLDGWRRMGRALGRLGALGAPFGALPAEDRAAFGRAHRRRVEELGDRLAPLATATRDWDRLSSPEVPGDPPLVLTHGDPGPGNFLDDGRDGTLIDWEEARVAPRGLDLARLGFIARLGSGPVGYRARDHDARAAVAATGYHEGLGGVARPTREESRWWTAVAGVQFIHHRWTRGGRPAPWEDAVDVLLAALG